MDLLYSTGQDLDTSKGGLHMQKRTQSSQNLQKWFMGGREHRAEKPRAWTVLPALAFHVSHSRHGSFMAAAISANCRKEQVTCHRCSSASSRERWGLDMEYPGGDRKLTQTGCAVRRVSFISGRLLKRENYRLLCRNNAVSYAMASLTWGHLDIVKLVFVIKTETRERI